MNDAHKTQMLDQNRTQLGSPPTADPNRTILGTAPSLNATQTIKPVQCPVCKTFNPAGVMFCVDCGLIFDKALPDDAFGAPAVQLPMLVDENGREHLLRPGQSAIGREGDIMLADAKVSRRHAQISNDEGRLTIEDLGSTNGTKVNGDKLAPGEKRTLNAGDKVSFGGVEMQLALPGQKGGNTTQVFATNKTAAMAAAPAIEKPAATLYNDEREYPVKPGVNSIGRKSGNDIVIPDPYVSGKHAQIEIADDGVYLVDLGSSNGTFVNDARLSEGMRTHVSADDVVRIGSLELRLRLTE